MQQFNLPENPVITIIGKPESGKSHLIKYLIHSMQKSRKTRYDIVIVFSKTKFNDAYSYVPNQWQHSKFKPDVIKSLMNIQSQIREQGKKPPKVLLLFDDCIQPSTFKTELFQDVIFNHRHYRFSIIMSFQYMLNNAPTFLRENSNGAFIFQQTTKNSITGVHDAFGSFMSESDYRQKMSELGNHRFLYFNLNDQTSEIMLAPPSIPDPKVNYIAAINSDRLLDV